MKLLSDAMQHKNDNFVIFVNFCDASKKSKKFCLHMLYSVCQIENEYKLEENKDRKSTNRLLCLIKVIQVWFSNFVY